MRLAHGYWRQTADTFPFDAMWRDSIRLSIATLDEQRRLHGNGPYQFRRPADALAPPSLNDDPGLPSHKSGLIHSAFRPSDDPCALPFHIPSNLFAVRALADIADVAEEAAQDAELAGLALAFSAEVATAVERHGIMQLEDGTRVYAYETDGQDNALFLDDANIPSLSSLAYLGACHGDEPVFASSARRAWSEKNPYFFSGNAATGIGSPHTGKHRIWPMSLLVHALTSDDPVTIRSDLQTLAGAGARTGFMHEAFDADDSNLYTRPWFGWANSLFAELIIKVEQSWPAILA